MTLLVDTSVWSLALRRNGQSDNPTVKYLLSALDGSEPAKHIKFKLWAGV